MSPKAGQCCLALIRPPSHPDLRNSVINLSSRDVMLPINKNESKEAMEDRDLLNETVAIVTSWVAANNCRPEELTAAIGAVHKTLESLAGPAIATEVSLQKPAVPIRRSVTPDYIICLEDGRKLKTLKRYLRTAYGMTPEEYRQKWGLPHDYPMAAPNYAAERSAAAKKIGLGRRRKAKTQPPVEPTGGNKRRRRTAAA